MNQYANEDCLCIVCGSGIYKDSYRLKVRGFNICPTCEKNLSSLRIEDDRYDFYKESIKKIWLA